MTVDEAVDTAANAPTWDARISAIRLVPEQFGTAAHQAVYAALARRIYLPSLAPDFAYVHWREDYEFKPIEQAYHQAFSLTNGFADVEVEKIASAILAAPATLRVFRVILGFTAQEFAAATRLVADPDSKALSTSRVRSIESGVIPKAHAAQCCARVIDLAMRRELFGSSPIADVRLKIEKPDTEAGWDSIRKYAIHGVPLEVFLHQRLYGGAFRQLLDATSSRRGDILEDAVSEIFTEHQIPFVRTGAHNQEEIAQKFGITVKPAPDFVVFDSGSTLCAILECKGANDGGTARDKAARFRGLRAEAARLGGTPLFAVLAGLGWTRTSDAMGPVVRDTDGRVFTIPTLGEMLTVQPFPLLVGTQF